MLGQHPELYGLPELNLFQCKDMGEFWSGRDKDGSSKSPFWSVMRHGLLRTVAQFYAGEQTIETIQMAERWIHRRRDVSTSDVFRELCEKAAPLRLVEKSPGYIRKTAYMRRIFETFPGARFIHLVRHPRGQCESVLNVKGGPVALFMMNSIDRTGAQPILDPQILWHDAHIQILNFLDEIPADQWIRVRGEDFMADMDRTLLSVCDWLGVSTDDEALDAMKHPEDSPFSCIGPANARLGNDPNFLNSPQLKPSKAKQLSLEGPLGWRPDGKPFHSRVVTLAHEFGYH
jgi:hypothetical protein